YLARFLGAFGIDLKEARVVPDVEAEIIAAVNALRSRYDYVFTTGGIGPTHDDITAGAIAHAFEVPIDYNAEALALLASRYKGGELNDMRKRMARIPAGATLIHNSVSAAPGFQIENVFVMAGVPLIMHAMLENIAPRLRRGKPVHTRTLSTAVAEGRIAASLAAIQAAHPSVSIGSYPYFNENGVGVNVVVRGRNPQDVEAATDRIQEALMAQEIGSKPDDR
ncbi:MAG: competence/damage-inducible protein A, partial [Alphaproteobacteria bacterium]|nr:competence/damage-inducible protein A [Alphaproteobacteria bacterium]